MTQRSEQALIIACRRFNGFTILLDAESDVPVIVQHTRLDSRQAANSVMTTMAFADTETVM